MAAWWRAALSWSLFHLRWITQPIPNPCPHRRQEPRLRTPHSQSGPARREYRLKNSGLQNDPRPKMTVRQSSRTKHAARVKHRSQTMTAIKRQNRAKPLSRMMMMTKRLRSLQRQNHATRIAQARRLVQPAPSAPAKLQSRRRQMSPPELREPTRPPEHSRTPEPTDD